MSKQLKLSAVAAALTMGLFALSASAGLFDASAGKHFAGNASLFDLNARY